MAVRTGKTPPDTTSQKSQSEKKLTLLIRTTMTELVTVDDLIIAPSRVWRDRSGGSHTSHGGYSESNQEE